MRVYVSYWIISTTEVASKCLQKATRDAEYKVQQEESSKGIQLEVSITTRVDFLYTVLHIIPASSHIVTLLGY